MHIWLEGGSTDAYIMDDKTDYLDRAKPILKMYNASGVHVSPTSPRITVTMS